MKTIFYLWAIPFVSLLISCSNSKGDTDKNTALFTEQEVLEVLNGTSKQLDNLSPREKQLRQILSDTSITYRAEWDSVQENIRLYPISEENSKAGKDVLLFSKAEYSNAIGGSLPEFMPAKEIQLRQKLYKIFVNCVQVDTIQKKIRFDVSDEDCIKLGLPATSARILKEEFEKGMKCIKQLDATQYDWYIKSMAKSIAAERVNKREGAIYFMPIEGGLPQ